MTISVAKVASDGAVDDGPAERNVLEVTDLKVDIYSPLGVVHAVRGVDFSLAAGESVAVVGESGSGKSVTGRALLGLMEPPAARTTGEVLFEGADVLTMNRRALQEVRGKGISVVFQDALTSLDPVMSVGKQLNEVLRVRTGMSRADAKRRAIELLTEVGIAEPERRYDSYPHELSGGMRQRICIALAISTGPRVLVADEPTTSLDVSVQAGILRLIVELQQKTGMAMLFVTHDLNVARRVASRVMVMYAGRVVESGAIEKIFAEPHHPYTRALLKSHPGSVESWRDLEPISGTPIDTRWNGDSCAFAPRCPMVADVCREHAPPMTVLAGGGASRCHFATEMTMRNG